MALRKNAKPRETIDAPTNRVRTGLAVMTFQTMPMLEVITVPASVSRLAAVTEPSGNSSFT